MKQKRKYHFNKFIFSTVVILNLITLIIVINETGTDLIKPYEKISCPTNAYTPCKIPLTLNRTLQPGETITNGNPNLKLAKKWNTTIITSLIIGIIINHLFYNRKYKLQI